MRSKVKQIMFLDDERFPGRSFWEQDHQYAYIPKTYEGAKTLCSKEGCPNYISFDHDLGLGLSGLDFAKWLIEQDLNTNGEFIPKDFTFVVHSQNPVGAKNIQELLTPYLSSKVL